MVHCETTTGVFNPLKEIAHLVKMHGKKLIVDAMSSFGGVPLDVHELGIDFLISSANKCIQGVPGFGFIIARRSELLHCKGVSKSLSLNIYDQWEAMEKGHGKWRFTSPTHVVRAFKQAMDELAEEGGVEARHNRYCENTACWWTACVPSVSKRCCRTRFNRPLLLLSSILMPISISKLSTHN